MVRRGKSICSYSRFIFPRCGLNGVGSRSLVSVLCNRGRRRFDHLGRASLPHRYGRYSVRFTYRNRYPGGHFRGSGFNRPNLGCLYGNCCLCCSRMTPCVSFVGGRLLTRHPPSGVVETLGDGSFVWCRLLLVMWAGVEVGICLGGLLS